MKKRDVLISVLMSVYEEKESYLTQAIESILSQTFKDFEYIIINDNPQRELNRIILSKYKYQDSRIRVVNNKENLGLTKSLNIGLKLATGKYIARMDADDISCKDRLAVQFDFMENNKEIIACGSYIQIFGIINRKDTKLPTNFKNFRNSLFLRNPLPHPSAFIRVSIIRAYQIQYNEELRYSQDYDLWRQLSKIGKLSNVPQILVKYRVDKNQISIRKKKDQVFCAQKIRQNLLKDELLNMGFSNKSDDPKLLFDLIISSRIRTETRDSVLLLLFLSFQYYTIPSFFRLLYQVKWVTLSKNYKIILLRMFYTKKYDSLL